MLSQWKLTASKDSLAHYLRSMYLAMSSWYRQPSCEPACRWYLKSKVHWGDQPLYECIPCAEGTNSEDAWRRKLLLIVALYLSIANNSLTARQQLGLPAQLSNAQHHLPTHDPHTGPPGRRWVNAPPVRGFILEPLSRSSLMEACLLLVEGSITEHGEVESAFYLGFPSDSPSGKGWPNISASFKIGKFTWEEPLTCAFPQLYTSPSQGINLKKRKK